jgi:DNA primase catalytic core
MSETLASLTTKGRPYLQEYLELNGVTINDNGKFRCIHPDHEDLDPSSGIIPESNGEMFHCFGCSANGDVFSAAHYLEGKPLLGPGFLSENLEYILSKFGIEHQPIELTKDQIDRVRFLRLHDAVVQTMLEVDVEGNLKHLDTAAAEERGWTTKTCLDLQIGSIKDLKEFTDAIQRKTSLTKASMEEMGVDKKLFGPKKITFVIRDHIGAVTGFVTRNLNWKRGSSIPKYENTSEFKNRFYDKSRLLYGLDKSKKLTGLRLDVFEGYGSYVTAYQAGYRNCAAIGGTAFTQGHVDLLYDLGFRHINLVFDHDETGKKLSESNIEKFSGYQGLKITIMKLPITAEELAEAPGNNDPDFYIRKHGVEAYRKLRNIGAFEYKISRTSLTLGSEEAIDFAKQTAKLILNEENRIERGRMVKVLSEHTGVDREDIEAEINRIEGTQVSRIRDDLQKQLRYVKDPDALGSLLDTAQGQLVETSSTKRDKYLASVGESVEIWTEIFSDMNQLKDGVHGWKTGYPALDNMLDGIAKPEKSGIAYGIAGSPQQGKSAAMLNIALRVAQGNDDASVLYWAIDDSRKAIAYRLVSIISGVPIKKVRRMIAPNKEEIKKILDAQNILIALCEDGRLIFKDDRFGRTKKKAEAWISDVQDKYGRHILFCADSLHNIYGGGEMRTKLVDSSTWVKGLCTRMPLSAIVTLEIIKNRGTEKPTLQSIAESGKMEFDFDAVAVAWNETHVKHGNFDMIDTKWGSPGNWKPVIELDFQKNKSAAGEKGSIYFHFDPATTEMVRAVTKIDGLEVSRPLVADMGGGAKITIENSKDSSRTLVRAEPTLDLRRP